MSLEMSAETTFLLDMTNGITYGTELHTSANAASDPNGNEADATTGFTATNLTGTGANVFESQGAVKNVGSYSIHTDADDTPTAGARFYVDLSGAPFSLVNGNQIRISFDWRHIGGAGGGWSSGTASNITLSADYVTIDSVNNSDTSFQSEVHTFVYSADTRYFGFKEGSASNNGGVYVDNLSVKKAV